MRNFNLLFYLLSLLNFFRSISSHNLGNIAHVSSSFPSSPTFTLAKSSMNNNNKNNIIDLSSSSTLSKSTVRNSLTLTKKNNKFRNDIDVLIIGGGLCGSTASFYLNQSGANVLLVEQKENLGGCIQTCQGDGFLWEEGANSFQPNKQFLQFLRDIQLLDQLILANSSLPRYIYWNEKLHPLPTSLSQLYRSKLFTWRGKLSLIAGLLGFVRRKPNHEESIEEFTTRHFGKEIYFRLIEPFVSGVYAGDPQRLSMSAALKKMYQLESLGLTRSLLEGGIVSMMKKKKSKLSNDDLPKIPAGSLGSMKNGIQSIPLQIQRILGPEHIATACTVENIYPFGEDLNRLWVAEIKTQNSDGTESLVKLKSKAILVTTPAYVTESLLSTSQSHAFACLRETINPLFKLGRTLKEVYYPPIVGLWTVYPDNAFKIKLDGFGNLIPRQTKIRTLGSIWATTLFKNRAPKGQNTLVNFIGGSLDPNITSLSDEEIVEQVDSDLRKIVLKPTAPRPHILGLKRWLKSIPQYERGFLSLQESIHRDLTKLSGLYLGGNYLSGVAVGDCIQYGTDITQTICQYLRDWEVKRERLRERERVEKEGEEREGEREEERGGVRVRLRERDEERGRGRKKERKRERERERRGRK